MLCKSLLILILSASPVFAGYNTPVPNAPDCQGTGQHWSYNVTTGVLICVTSQSATMQLSNGGAVNFYAISGLRSPRDRLLNR